jgi:hypothetical protein
MLACEVLRVGCGLECVWSTALSTALQLPVSVGLSCDAVPACGTDPGLVRVVSVVRGMVEIGGARQSGMAAWVTSPAPKKERGKKGHCTKGGGFLVVLLMERVI